MSIDFSNDAKLAAFLRVMMRSSRYSMNPCKLYSDRQYGHLAIDFVPFSVFSMKCRMLQLIQMACLQSMGAASWFAVSQISQSMCCDFSSVMFSSSCIFCSSALNHRVQVISTECTIFLEKQALRKLRPSQTESSSAMNRRHFLASQIEAKARFVHNRLYACICKRTLLSVV